MSKIDFIRAWKDEDYRLSLNFAELARLPENPAGVIDLSESELEVVVGAATALLLTFGCCMGWTEYPGWCPFNGAFTDEETLY